MAVALLLQRVLAKSRGPCSWLSHARAARGALTPAITDPFLKDKDAYTRQDVLEALGKIVEGKVLADTAKSNNGLSDWVNDFLTLIRKWVSEAVAMVRLGHEVNKVLSDSGARERLGDELVNLVEDLAHKNTEFMRGLQRDATLRYTTEAATMKPDPTPILTEAMEKHGEQVRKERETRERQHKALSDDIAAACAAEDGFSASVEQIDEIKALQAEEDALEFQRKGEFEYADIRTENRAEAQDAASGSGGQGTADRGADAQAGTEVQRGVSVRRSEVQPEDIRGAGGLLRAGRSLRNLASRVHRFHGEASSKASALGFYTGHLYELRQDDAEAAQAFADCINAAKASRGVLGDCVYTYEVEEYRKMRLFLTPDGKAGIALKPNGDMVSVFTHREQKNSLGGKTANALITLAINEGAVKADCYGYFLVQLYGKHGFRAIAKDTFNAAFAADAMKNRETMLANFKDEDGKPDVVYLVYEGDREHVLDDFNESYKPTFQHSLGYSDYDTCCATQDAAVRESRKIEALPAEVKQPVLDATNDIDLRHLGLVELTRVKSERNRRRAVDMVHAGAVLQESGVDVTTEAGAQKVADMAEYAARCREQLEARAQKPMDEETQARVLATLMCWNRWTELGELVDAAAAWDGKKRVTPKLIEAPTEDAGFSASIRTPLLNTADEAKAALKPIQGKVFENKQAGIQARVTNQTLGKTHSAQMSVANLKAMGYSDGEARKIHYSAVSRIHELFEQAEHWFFEDNYDTKQKAGRRGAYHFFGMVEVDGFGVFNANVSVVAPTDTSFDNRIFTLELTIENPTEVRQDSLSQRGLSNSSVGSSEVRVAAYRSFVEKEKSAIRKKAEEDGTLWLAPNGEPSSLSHDQWTTVRTKAFKDWFGDWENDPKNASKVLDENGEPLVVYHGSQFDFTAFDKERQKEGSKFGKGFYFTDDYARAKRRANPLFSPPDTAQREPMAVFLNIRDENDIHLLKGGRWTEYVAHEPTQIKSATDNRGTFDADNADISFSIRFEDSATTGHSGLSAGHMAFAQVIADNASRMLAAEIERFRTFDDKVQGSREKALSGWSRRGALPPRAGRAASGGGRERARAEPRTEAPAPWWKGAPGRGRRQSRPPAHT